jgi:hypothetical protein
MTFMMRTLVLGLLFLAQAQTYPPPYPRPGTTKVMENDLVIVWDVSWLKQAYPTHRHVYDYAGIYYTDGDRIIVSEQGTRSPTHSVAWDTFFLQRGITHSEEGASEQPLRGVFLEFKQPQPVGTPDTRTSPPAFPATSSKQLRDSERVTIWEITPAPGASSPPHRHVRDDVIVTFAALKPRVTFVARGTMDSDNHTAGADRAFVFEVK